MPRPRLVPEPADLALAALAAWVSTGPVPVPDPWAVTRVGAGPAGALWWGAVVLTVAGLLVRSRRPVTCLVLLTAGLTVHLLVFTGLSVLAVLSGLTGAWTIQSRLTAPGRWAALAAAYLAASLGLVRARFEEDPPLTDPTTLVVLVAGWSLLTVAALGGAAQRRGRERVEAALERAEVVRQAMTAERRLAVATERTRIARDVHDLLGHSLAVIGMQAAGAGAVVDRDPAAARQALDVIGTTARRSSQEVHALVDVLREDLDTGTVVPAPDRQPLAPAGAAGPAVSVAGLVSTHRRAGAHVVLTSREEREATAAEQRLLAEVVREVLTNAARHAPGAPLAVGVTLDGAGLVLTATNPVPTGATTPAAVPPAPAPGRGDGPAPGAGGGRRGMGLDAVRSRLAAVGGTLEAGYEDGADGPAWRLRAVVPARGQEGPA